MKKYILLCFLYILQTNLPAKTQEPTAKKNLVYAYLAGPDVFLPNPLQIGEEKKLSYQRLVL